MAIGLVNDVGLNHQVVVDKVRRIGGVGPDPPHPGRGQEDVVRAFPAEKIGHRGLIPKVQFR